MQLPGARLHLQACDASDRQTEGAWIPSCATLVQGEADARQARTYMDATASAGTEEEDRFTVGLQQIQYKHCVNLSKKMRESLHNAGGRSKSLLCHDSSPLEAVSSHGYTDRLIRRTHAPERATPSRTQQKSENHSVCEW